MTKTTYLCLSGNKKRQNGRYAIRTNLAHEHTRFRLIFEHMLTAPGRKALWEKRNARATRATELR